MLAHLTSIPSIHVQILMNFVFFYVCWCCRNPKVPQSSLRYSGLAELMQTFLQPVRAADWVPGRLLAAEVDAGTRDWRSPGARCGRAFSLLCSRTSLSSPAGRLDPLEFAPLSTLTTNTAHHRIIRRQAGGRNGDRSARCCTACRPSPSKLSNFGLCRVAGRGAHSRLSFLLALCCPGPIVASSWSIRAGSRIFRGHGKGSRMSPTRQPRWRRSKVCSCCRSLASLSNSDSLSSRPHPPLTSLPRRAASPETAEHRAIKL